MRANTKLDLLPPERVQQIAGKDDAPMFTDT
jgi:hypothetical protein